ncbi:hypothetical protein [Streptomyces sp. NPDC005302]|uniref:hypothetical protein n=1 Tax=Streptomyces sp. NPDC005302 TaxID=3154675 RepID=UPI0033A72F46
MPTATEELDAAINVLRNTSGAEKGRLDSDSQELLVLVAVLLRIREPVAAWLESEAARLNTSVHPGGHDTLAGHARAVASAALARSNSRPGPAEPGPIIDNTRAELASRMGVQP